MTIPPEQERSMIEARDAIQKFVLRWAGMTYGTDAIGVHERAIAFLEEALEVAQAFGLGRPHVAALTNRVFDRKAGERWQEIGGVAVTLMALAEAAGMSVADCERLEIERFLSLDPAKLRAKYEAKNRR